MQKAVISSDTPAIRELFIDKENILLCEVASAEDLAKKILYLKNNEKLAERISINGYKLFENKCRTKVIVKKLSDELKKIINE